jgi:hypothetical protein
MSALVRKEGHDFIYETHVHPAVVVLPIELMLYDGVEFMMMD